jgi:vitamin B12 transporter
VDDNDAFGTFGTWRAGAAFALSPTTSVRTAVGSAFREPTFFQNFASGFVRGNPNLAPEKATSWEVGFEQRLLADRLTLSGTWFDQRFRDLIEFTFETASPTDPNYFNIAGAEARGIELEGRVELPGGLTASAGHTWLDTKVLDAGFDQSGTGFFVAGDHLLRRPAHTTTAGLAWRIDRRADVAVRVLSFGRRDDIDYSAGQRVSLPSYTTVDLSATVDLTRRHRGGNGLSLTMRLANALDERYDAVLGFRSPGRTLLTGFEVVF